MKNIILTILFTITLLSVKAQDTICTMITLDEVIEFNYQTNEIISRYDNTGTTFITVGCEEILCLHLYDKKLRVRKVITTFSDGDMRVDILDSKDNTYFSPLGAALVVVKKPRFIILK